MSKPGTKRCRKLTDNFLHVTEFDAAFHSADTKAKITLNLEPKNTTQE